MLSTLSVSGETLKIFQYGTLASNEMLRRIQRYLNTEGDEWINYEEEDAANQDEDHLNDD
ncbi:hypothetical protein QCA50_019877 [Cerrena zonata]|uniref:Uncharacterized protein n=1 Tax=Cerrena zonata TaxID=2478898 RepID=A0AAW0F8T4_9APHY